MGKDDLGNAYLYNIKYLKTYTLNILQNTY